jgi:hypothetical protein
VIEVGQVVKSLRWDDHTGTVVRVDGEDVYVQWHGTCVEDETAAEFLKPVDLPNPPDNGLRYMVIGG